MREKEKLRKNDLSGVQADRSVETAQPTLKEILKDLFARSAIGNAIFEEEFRSLFGKIANLKILSRESPVFVAIGKQKKIIFLSRHSNEKEPSYLRDLVGALMKGDENNKVILLLELHSDFDLNEVIKLINEDPSLFEKISSFPENVTNLIKTLGKLKEKYGERFEVMLIDIPAAEVLKATNDLSELAELAGIGLKSELTKRLNVSEEEFESMSTKSKIEILNTCNDIIEMIINKTKEKIESMEKSESISDEDIKDIEHISRYLDLILLNRNIKIVENVEKIYNRYKGEYNIFYGGLLHGLEILKELKEVEIPPSQKVTVYIPEENIPSAYVFLRSPTSKERAKTDTFGKALRD